jgi:type II secretory ATPase GspE/PulE/Tfp pilus assembly ATPase PilB-like protein
MKDLGADPEVLATTLRAVLHQRLLTVRCSECAGPACACRGVGRRRVPDVEILLAGEAE